MNSKRKLIAVAKGLFMHKNTNLNKVKSAYSFWGRFPLLYASQDFITFMGRAEYIRKRAVIKLKLQKANKVLEVACGTGRNFPYIMEAIGPGGKLVGFDYTQEMLDAAKALSKEKKWQNISFTQGDAAELKVEEVHFDGVLSVLGISAIPKWEDALKRCKDVLRIGGVISICDAQLFEGVFRVLNPLVKIVYSNLAAWNPSNNIPVKLKELFGNVSVENFNFGTFFIATSVKETN